MMVSLDVSDAPTYTYAAVAMTPRQRTIKRRIDIILSVILLILALPIMLLVTLAIKLESAGPVFFLQERVGEKGRHFQIYKFRSMVINHKQLGVDLVKQRDDERVTTIGRIIRRFSLDELPQLLNVFKGDMSLVGPRPELPQFVARYEPWQHDRLCVPQGMTGWWQINGRSERPMHLHTHDDLTYIRNFSLWLDLYILLRTPLVVLRGNGAF